MQQTYLKKIFLLYSFYAAQCFAFDKLSLDETTGLFTVVDKTMPVISTQYIGWEANWVWANVDITPDTANTTPILSYTGHVTPLDIDFTNTVIPNNGKFTWTYDWNKKADHPTAYGVGVEFNLQTASPTFETTAQAPELLPDRQGWRWQTPDGQSVEVKFSPAVAKIYFEREQKNQIRVLFFSPIEKGTQQTTMTVSFSNNVALANSLTSAYGGNDTQNWQQNSLSEKVSPVDLSFLNNNELPAGKHGFVKARADKLVFEDDTPIKFWGANLQAYALFNTSDIDIKTHAKRLAQLGFNLIRIHHHDSKWVNPNIFANQSDNTLEFSQEAFKKLDLWIKTLKDRGIYVWLDLHVGREVTKNDGIENFEELAKGKESAEVKGFNYFNESIQHQMQKFNEAYLNHVNPYTKLAYKADPAVIALLVTNENDLTQHFGNALLSDKGVPLHNALFNRDAGQFSEATGLPIDKVTQTWEMGESKIYLSDVEHRFNQKMRSHLQNLGAKSMVATTNSWGYMGLFGLPSLTDGDLIDAHSYGVAEEFNRNPRYNPSFLTWVGAAQVTAKPLSVTEWNMGAFPAADRHTMPLYAASIANLQGWDAMMLYGYSQDPLGGESPGSNWSSYSDPAVMGVMPAAALLYRQNHVAPAKQQYELKLSREDFFFKRQDPSTSKTIRTLMETSRLTIGLPGVPELPWLSSNNPKTEDGSIAVTDANKDFIPIGQDFVQSDTGELQRNWVKGIHTINTEKSQVISGWIGGQKINLKDVSFSIGTKKAVVAVQSLTEQPVSKSTDIFITAMARSQPNGSNGFVSEPVVGTIVVKAPAGLQLYPINSLGVKSTAVAIKYQAGKYIIDLKTLQNTHWFKLSNS